MLDTNIECDEIESNSRVEPSNITFSLYTPEEISKLSHLEIRTPLIFDSIGQPLPSGLHDSVLGPLEDFSEPCGTCKATLQTCPGHWSHIELPLPVTNPLFYKTVAQVIKLTCIECYKVQVPVSQKYLLITQLRLLSEGYTTEAQDAVNHLPIIEEDTESNGPAIEALAKESLDQYRQAVLASGSQEMSLEKSKIIQSCRTEFLSELFKMVQAKKICLHCKQRLGKFSFTKNILYLTIVEMDKEKKKAVATKPKCIVMPSQAKEILQRMWEHESELILALCPMLKNSDLRHPTDQLFLDLILVIPPKSRPVQKVDNKVTVHPQTNNYKPIIQDCFLLRHLIRLTQSGEEVLSEDAKTMVAAVVGNTATEKLQTVWQELQADVDHLMDKELSDTSNAPFCLGLKQIMEKKEGCIRQNMMGKRVNYAARSVITPDPNLDIDEIGLPETFATILTYPVPVTSFNVADLRQMVLNGPLVHPGAVLVEHENGMISKISGTDQVQRETLAKCLLTPDSKATTTNSKGTGYKIVHRHLINGDILLLNRQPTLHRPSIMAHKARILKGEKTLRLNYANCKAYNADFDGDEMNAHCPQNELARSEAYNLVNVCNNYLVPKDGTPLSGLIQDHVIAGVKLTMRGRFFSREDYNQLVYQALASNLGNVILLPPAIMKPFQLWSGKQIISTIIINIIPHGRFPINLDSTAKISGKAWENEKPRPWKAGGTPFTDPMTMSEAAVIIRRGELMCGILDKTHYGATPYGLVHCLYELYGGICSSKLLSAFSKLFTAFLQLEGFTLGVEDILVVPNADKTRSQSIVDSRCSGDKAAAGALGLTPTSEKLKEKLLETLGMNRVKWRTIVDRSYKSTLDSYTNDINKACLPAGLLRKFPENNLQLMVQSGAKGSTVNTMQISCLLGQIELEGKRPPLMVSGKSLPMFPKLETSPRAGGFIDGRFLTGIKPPEFFFHCMAGREGLIDTAVKTSRSGYLQRCLVKHLEGLTVHYDQTVRDSDGTVVQYYYGEDSLDVIKAQFLTAKQFPFLISNANAIIQESNLLENKSVLKDIVTHTNKISDWLAKHDLIHNTSRKRISPFTTYSTLKRNVVSDEKYEIMEKQNGRTRAAIELSKMWRDLDEETRNSLNNSETRCPDPVSSIFQVDRDFGAITESMEMLMLDYIGKLPEQDKSVENKLYRGFRKVLSHKSMKSVCPAGEPVGLLAAQSIGEPSTQMTLNTFHFAGRGDMNVTLGIPRLREILMVASKNIKTPSMDIPFKNDLADLEAKASEMKKTMTRVTLNDVLEGVDASHHLQLVPDRKQVYRLKMHFLPPSKYSSMYAVTPDIILSFIETKFVNLLMYAVKKREKIPNTLLHVQTKAPATEKEPEEGGEEVDDPQRRRGVLQDTGAEEESSDEEPLMSDDDATTARSRERHGTREYEDPDEEDDAEEVEAAEDEGFAEMSGSLTESNESPEKATEGSKRTPVKSSPRKSRQRQVRRQTMLTSSPYVMDYDYDIADGAWCWIDIGLSLDIKRLDFTTLIKELAQSFVIWELPLIKRSFTYVNPDQDQLTFKTDGINIPAMYKYHDFLDLNKLYTNDIHGMANIYGIEAGRRVIVKEVQDVFKMYGITVDPRHLLLIADYMTFNGVFEPLSRKGMEKNVSPFQQMSFEASLTFLKTATVTGMRDQLESPSSRVMVGRPCKCGTGVFDIVQSFTGIQPQESRTLGPMKRVKKHKTEAPE